VILTFRNLFCFPYAGGSAVVYHQWANWMSGRIEVTPAQLPGRSNRIREAASIASTRSRARSPAPIHHLADSGFIAGLRPLHGTPETILREPDLLELMFPTFRADFAAIETCLYRQEPPLECPITAFGGLAGRIPHQDLDAWWMRTHGPFTLQIFPGGHFFLHGAGSSVPRADL